MKREPDEYHINRETVFRDIEGQTFFILPDASDVYETNESGSFLWKQLRDNKSCPEMIRALSQKFKIPQAAADRDVRSFLKELEKKNMIRRRPGNA